MKLNKEVINAVIKLGRAKVKYGGIEFLLCRQDLYRLLVRENYKVVPINELKEVDDISKYLNIKFMFNRIFGENRVFWFKKDKGRWEHY